MIVAAVTVVLLLQNPSGSLYSDSASNLFLFRDLKARAVGDILTIQIEESATATNSADTSTEKKGDLSLKFGLESKSPSINFGGLLSGSGARTFDGTGSTSRTGQLQAYVSARVIQVFPNGDLGIEGVKEVTVNRERQILRIRGIVRTRDVSPNNVVLSTGIANMEVVFDGKGIVTDANKPGWLFKLMQWVSPF
jgi:flagellar L-ring protein precursor FlgH